MPFSRLQDEVSVANALLAFVDSDLCFPQKLAILPSAILFLDMSERMLIKIACLMAVLAIGASFSTLFSTRTGSRAVMKMVAIGDNAPDFELKTYNGKVVKLSSFKNKKPVVVFFYPADNTPGCTTEVCAFERKAPDFRKVGAEVLGISSGGATDKEKFVRTNKLTSMELLIDAGDKVRNAWKVPRALFGAFPGRVTYVVGKDGKIKSIYDDIANAAMHPEKALAGLANA